MKHRGKAKSLSPELQAVLDAAAAMSSSGQEPRKHHLVPKFYLERWSADQRIKVTDLDNGRRTYLVAPANALVERDYYRVQGEHVLGGSPVVWETWLSKIESDAAEVFAAIDTGGLETLTEVQFSRLVHFIAVQVTRSRSHRFRGRWMMGAGLHRLMELDREGAIRELLVRAGEHPTEERINEIEEYFTAAIADPWKVPMDAAYEMELAGRSAANLASTLATRRFMLYRTRKTLLTSDEPVVLLYEHMGADHPDGGGFYGAPIVVFPVGPHSVLAMFREGVPVVRSNDRDLDWSETLELNRVIAGNAHRHLVEVPSGRLSERLYLPDRPDPTRMVALSSTDGTGREIVWMPAQHRWTGDKKAPIRAVSSWWPSVVPPASRRPTSPAE